MAELNPEITKNEAKQAILAAQNLKDLERVFGYYLGKNGEVKKFFEKLKTVPADQKKDWGAKTNELKVFLEKAMAERKAALEKLSSKNEKEKSFDPDRPGKKPEIGHLHPLTQTKREIISIFTSMGFEVVLGPEVEDEWHNFDALNIPKDHPARDAWNTVWVLPKNPGGKKPLLRTHTSPMQARYLETHQPPLRIIVPGKVFRYEATDASHEAQFYQLEGLMVDKYVSAANFKAVIGEFFKRFFGKDLKFRLRPDFFPFTEPSFEVAMTCLTCLGKGCPVCKRTGWLEMAGAGMVHPHVLESCGLDPKKWQGWAFGFGWNRLAMMKYKIDNIRLLTSGDLRFLEQF